jgi:pyruvate-formate lyase-activating enzyme
MRVSELASRGGTVSPEPDFLSDLLRDLVEDSLTTNLMTTTHLEKRLTEKLKSITPDSGSSIPGAGGAPPSQPSEIKK